ncbi:MAG: coproporphyrinogen-III oxidase family protein, partial [Bryobacteraceae bacterium]
ISPGKARRWCEVGINRISLGVQSFAGAELARTGRRHNAEIVARECAVLRESGIANFNVDLIAGLPGQTAASWRESLDWIARIDPPHVSVYMLEIDQDSRLGSEILRGGGRYGAGAVPSEDLTADLYETAVERLEQMGILRYEISNFARPGLESAHNLKYWRLEPYAGFGADAHSFDGAMRRQNVESPSEYVARAGNPVAEIVPADPAEERLFVGLRLREGVRPAPGDWLRFERPIQRFMDEGLLESGGGVLRLTPRGVLLSNEVFQEFLTR